MICSPNTVTYERRRLLYKFLNFLPNVTVSRQCQMQLNIFELLLPSIQNIVNH